MSEWDLGRVQVSQGGRQADVKKRREQAKGKGSEGRGKR